MDRSEQIAQLVESLRKASDAAIQADIGKDGGVKNMDDVAIQLRDWSDADIEKAAIESGISLQAFEWGHETYHWINIPANGQANRRKIMVEAACRSLCGDGWNASVFRMF